MAISADLSKYLDKAYESSTLEEILAAPVSALAGVTDDDAEAPDHPARAPDGEPARREVELQRPGSGVGPRPGGRDPPRRAVRASGEHTPN